MAGHVLSMLSSSSDIKAAVEKIKAAPESGVTEVKAIIEMYAQLQVHQAAWQKSGEPLMHIEEAMSRFQRQHSIQEAAVPCLNEDLKSLKTALEQVVKPAVEGQQPEVSSNACEAIRWSILKLSMWSAMPVQLRKDMGIVEALEVVVQNVARLDELSAAEPTDHWNCLWSYASADLESKLNMLSGDWEHTTRVFMDYLPAGLATQTVEWVKTHAEQFKIPADAFYVGLSQTLLKKEEAVTAMLSTLTLASPRDAVDKLQKLAPKALVDNAEAR